MRTLALVSVFLFSFNAFAQKKPDEHSQCGASEPTEAEMQKKPYYGNNAYLTKFVDSLTRTFQTNSPNARGQAPEINPLSSA